MSTAAMSDAPCLRSEGPDYLLLPSLGLPSKEWGDRHGQDLNLIHLRSEG